MRGELDDPGESNWLVGISTSTDPTLYGPVYCGNSGVGLSLESQAIFATVGLDLRRVVSVPGTRKSDNVSGVYNRLLGASQVQGSSYMGIKLFD